MLLTSGEPRLYTIKIKNLLLKEFEHIEALSDVFLFSNYFGGTCKGTMKLMWELRTMS